MSRSRADARPTIYDVAARAGVSKSLVSLVLQGSPKVAAARRAAVLTAVAELGYRPSQHASALAGRRTRVIGVVVEDFRNPWFADLLHGMRDVLDDTGFHIAVADDALNAHVGIDPVEGFLAQGVDGMVLAGGTARLTAAPAGTALVIAGGQAWESDVDTVANDDERGTALAVDHVLRLGHRTIGHVTGHGPAAAARRTSFERAVRAAGAEPVVLVGDEMSEASGHHLTMRLLSDRPDVTVVLAGNDAMALGVVAAARDLGRAVPEDLSVVGYDDAPIAQSRLLALTTVDGRNSEVGTHCARALLSRLAEPDRAPTCTLIAPSLVVRSSTARLAA